MTETRFCRQPGLAVLRVSGIDARAFLHAQLTQRIDDINPRETRLAAWLTAKGRVRALFDVIQAGEDFLLLLPADNAAAVATGLSRFVLRARVRIEEARSSQIFSVTGAIDDWLEKHGIELPAAVSPATVANAIEAGGSGSVAGGSLSHAGGSVIIAGDAVIARTSPGRVDLIVNGELPAGLFAGLAETDSDRAALAAIAEGRAEIPAALTERYVPQMLNLDRLAAISFIKGCYPGQEIVARTQNLGEVKRRLRRLGAAAGPRPAPGDGIVDGTGGEVGEVNRSAATTEGFELLAVIGIEAAREGLRLAADGRALVPLALPGQH
jgi:folate-binding protein YgfZ